MMELDETAERMLTAVHLGTAGDSGRSASMWSVGEGLGLDRGRSEDVAMGLVAEGLLEIINLSGGVALTQAGHDLVGSLQGTGEPAGRPDMTAMIDRLEASLEGLGVEPPTRRDLELDIRLLKTQRDRSEPLPGVIPAALEAIRKTLASSAAPPKTLLEELSSCLSGP